MGNPFARRPAAAAALATVALSLLSLGGWRAGVWQLTTLASDRLPMAPSTAATFLIFGVALLGRAVWPSSRVVFSLGRILTAGAVAMDILVAWLSRTGAPSPWDNWFPGVGTEVGGVPVYIVAQDAGSTPNVGSFPSAGAAGFTANPPAASTPPTTPSSFSHVPTISGTYTVGVGGNYTTITDAVNAYNNSCLGGPVIFSLTDATYPSETFPITINNNVTASALNTLLIKPTVLATISGSSTTAIIKINAAKYVTINGSVSNTVNTICPLPTASRDLTIENTNTAVASVI